MERNPITTLESTQGLIPGPPDTRPAGKETPIRRWQVHLLSPKGHEWWGGQDTRKNSTDCLSTTVFVLPILPDQRNQLRSFQSQTLRKFKKYSLLVKSKLGIWEWKNSASNHKIGKQNQVSYGGGDKGNSDNQLGKAGVCNACMCLKGCLPSSKARVLAKLFFHTSTQISFQNQQHVSKSVELI